MLFEVLKNKVKFKRITDNSISMKFNRDLTLWAIIATALCGVIGGGINVLIIDVQRELMIGDYLPLAILVAGVLAFVISLVYSILSTAMPKAGGEYLYISTLLTPKLGFPIGFIKFMGAVISLGAVAYMDSTVFATVLDSIGYNHLAELIRTPLYSAITSTLLITLFWFINRRGTKEFGLTVQIFAALMIIGGIAISWVGISHNHDQFLSVYDDIIPEKGVKFGWNEFFSAVAVMFWAYIGFTSIAQTGDEAKDPKKTLPKAFMLTSIIVMLYYFAYSYAFYHAVPWQAVLNKPNTNVPYFINYFLPPIASILLSLFVFLAIMNDIPPLLYTKSRLLYSWGRDGILPKWLAKLNKRGIPVHALDIVALLGILVGIISSYGGVLDEVNIVVLSRFFLYVLVALSLIKLRDNKELAKKVTFIRDQRVWLVLSGIVILAGLSMAGLTIYNDWHNGKLITGSTGQTAAIFLVGYLIYKRQENKGLKFRPHLE